MKDEYETLAESCPDGIYLFPNIDAGGYDGVMFPTRGIYATGVFRFKIVDHRLRFITNIVHPFVDKHTQLLRIFGKFNLLGLMQYLQRVIEIDSFDDLIIFKSGASDVIHPNMPSDGPVDSMIKECVKNSDNYLYEDPDSIICFFPWDLDVHQQALDKVLGSTQVQY